MLDIKFIRENKDIVQAGAKKKHIEIDIEKFQPRITTSTLPPNPHNWGVYEGMKRVGINEFLPLLDLPLKWLRENAPKHVLYCN